MNFTPTDEQVLLRDSARAMLAKECPPSLVRRHIDDPSAADELAPRLAEFAGLATGLCTDLCIFLEETGYVAAPGPFFASTALFASVLTAAGHELAEAVAAGETTGTVAMAGARGDWVPNDDPVKTFVPEADRVEWLAVVGGDAAAPTLHVVPTSDLPAARLVQMIDFSRRLFEVDTASLGDGTPLDRDALAAALDRVTAAVAAELVGTSRRLFDMGLAYVKERYQFDVPIGSFQAIQHKLAEASLAVERATAAVQYASMTVDAGDPERARACHVAKAAANAAAARSAKDAAQVHGGIGYTWEHDLHLFLRRAVGTEHWLGTADWHHDRIADLLLA